MSVEDFMAINPTIVEIFQSGPVQSTDQPPGQH